MCTFTHTSPSLYRYWCISENMKSKQIRLFEKKNQPNENSTPTQTLLKLKKIIRIQYNWSANADCYVDVKPQDNNTTLTSLTTDKKIKNKFSVTHCLTFPTKQM